MTALGLAAQPDSELCSLAAAGSEAAFEALVERYRRPLISYCRRMMWPDGEDVVQDAFLNAWCALRAGTEVRHTKAWLYRIVRNQALNRLRRGDGDLDPLPESLAGADGAEFQVERCVTVRETLAAVADLPELQREAILMTAVHGASYEQAAESLGLSDDTLRGLVYRARASLRAAFAAVTPPPLLVWVLQQDISAAATPVIGVVGGGNALRLLSGLAVLASTANIAVGSAGELGRNVGVGGRSQSTSALRASRRPLRASAQPSPSRHLQIGRGQPVGVRVSAGLSAPLSVNAQRASATGGAGHPRPGSISGVIRGVRLRTSMGTAPTRMSVTSASGRQRMGASAQQAHTSTSGPQAPTSASSARRQNASSPQTQGSASRTVAGAKQPSSQTSAGVTTTPTRTASLQPTTASALGAPPTTTVSSTSATASTTTSTAQAPSSSISVIPGTADGTSSAATTAPGT
jgi:RNA polymerase sigma-70 factor (ECF subfamily)